MAFTLDAVRSCGIPMTAPPFHAVTLDQTQIFRQLSSTHARVISTSSDLFDLTHRSWITRIASPRTLKQAEHSKPCTNIVQPCLNTFLQPRDGKEIRQLRSRSSVIARCEMGSPEETPPEHEEEQKCIKGERGRSDHTPAGCEGCAGGAMREWKGAESGMESESEMDDARREYTPRQCEGRVSSTLSVADKGYVIKVSKELMGLFCYIEKRKRTMIKELADTLRQIAAVSVAVTCVRGVFGPLVEVFKTTPPTWSKLLLMLVSIDSIAICYLTIKSAEPLEQLAAITTENRRDIMESVEKEEETTLKMAIEFIRLFKRLRNIAISITVSQTAQLVFTVLRMKDPNFVANCLKVVQTWMQAPWI